MTQEVLKLALAYIEAVPDDRYNAEHIDRDALITAINKVLAQTQEPFGYFQYDIRLDAWVQNRKSNRGAAFYTRPPQRKPLTDGEIDFHLDKILIAAGSALKHYSMQKTKDDMRQALREAFV